MIPNPQGEKQRASYWIHPILGFRLWVDNLNYGVWVLKCSIVVRLWIGFSLCTCGMKCRYNTAWVSGQGNWICSVGWIYDLLFFANFSLFLMHHSIRMGARLLITLCFKFSWLSTEWIHTVYGPFILSKLQEMNSTYFLRAIIFLYPSISLQNCVLLLMSLDPKLLQMFNN